MSGNGLPNSSRSIANSGSPEKCDAAVKDNGSVKSNTSGAPRNQSGTSRLNMALALGNGHEPPAWMWLLHAALAHPKRES
jgi:hypothetical protein